MCSRCVRFTDEVSKTEELGIFNRGDRSEIGTVDGKELNNKYSLNTVDICPVGALTSKDFRFRQRVWYLKDSETICNGCSTGCSVKVYFNKEGFFRVKPMFNEKVNGHWMCDEGRDVYKFVNKEHRLTQAKKRAGALWTEMMPGAAAKEAALVAKSSGAKTALVLTGQYTLEEYESIVGTFVNDFKSKHIYHWWPHQPQAGEFDGLLLRGDKNPNTKGLQQVFAKYGITTKWSDLVSNLGSAIDTVVVAGPENLPVYAASFAGTVKELSKAKNLIWLQAVQSTELESLTGNVWLIPMKTFVEKNGTFVNHAGLAQRFKKATTVVSEALTLAEAGDLISGKQLMIKPDSNILVNDARAADMVTIEHRKKNEFVFKRGTL